MTPAGSMRIRRLEFEGFTRKRMNWGSEVNYQMRRGLAGQFRPLQCAELIRKRRAHVSYVDHGIGMEPGVSVGHSLADIRPG